MMAQEQALARHWSFGRQQAVVLGVFTLQLALLITYSALAGLATAHCASW